MFNWRDRHGKRALKNPTARGKSHQTGSPASAPVPLPIMLPAPSTGLSGTQPGSVRLPFNWQKKIERETRPRLKPSAKMGGKGWAAEQVNLGRKKPRETAHQTVAAALQNKRIKTIFVFRKRAGEPYRWREPFLLKINVNLNYWREKSFNFFLAYLL